MTELIPPPEIDREQAFLIYATFAGDVEKTAHALGLRAIDVLRVVDEDKWIERLKPIIDLKKSAKPGDLDRAMNRALNWAQSHRMRLLVERVLHRIVNMTNDELEEHLSTRDKMGGRLRQFSFRALADLATALEKAQAMSYQALSDTVQDRTRRQEHDGGERAGSELHERIAEAMAAVGASQSPRAQLLDAQLIIAGNARQEKIARTPEPAPGNPLDNDDH